MKKTLYTLLFFLSFTFISCNDDKENETEIAPFDFTFLNEHADENTIKLYEDDLVSIFKDMEIWYNGSLEKKRGEWLLTAHSVDSNRMNANLLLNWELKPGENKTEIDTFKITGWGMDMSGIVSEPGYGYYKGYIDIRSFKFRENVSEEHPALRDSLYIKGSFNLQFIDAQKRTKILKGILNYAGLTSGYVE